MFFASFFLAGIGWGITADSIYVEGRLLRNGIAPTAETVRITTMIYELGATEPSWQRTSLPVLVKNGHFSMRLDWSDGGIFARNLMWNLDWLKEYEIQFNIVGWAPARQRLSAVPYTFMTKRVHGGIVDGASLKAVYPGTASIEAAISWTTTEAVYATIGNSATGEIASAKWSTGSYYGIETSGMHGVYAESSGIAAYGGSGSSLEAYGTGVSASGPVSLQLTGPIKIQRHTTSIPGATGIVTMTAGSFTVEVVNPLVRASRTLVFLSSLNTLEHHYRIWIDGFVRDGSFTIKRESATGSIQVGYLLIN